MTIKTKNGNDIELSGELSIANSTKINSNGIELSPGVSITFADGSQLENAIGVSDRLHSIGNSETTKTLSLADGNVQTLILNQNCIFTMPSVVQAGNLTMIVNQTASYTATFNTVKWSSGIAPTITTGAGKIDILSFISDGVSWYGGVIQNLS
jgi:hypothetical protein